jgi:hypothetical protein
MFRVIRAVSCAAALLAAPAFAQAPKTVNLIVFPGGFKWPIWVAQEKGLFARNGVEPTVPGAHGEGRLSAASADRSRGRANGAQLRSTYGEPKKVLADPAKYYGPSFYDAAMKR